MARIVQYSAETLALAVQYLERGLVISFPTETVYALACSAANQKAIDKIIRIKQRAASQVFAILVQDRNTMAQYAHIDEKTSKLIDKFSPKPLTCVLKYKPSSQICGSLIKDNKIGIRIPNHHIARDILRLYRKPIVATSVNLTAKPSACSVDEMPTIIKDKIDLIIDGGQCDLGIASTVVDFTSDEPQVLR